MRTHATRLQAHLAQVPLVAILRGLRGEEAVAVVEALWRAGLRVAEVPLNSPEPFDTIAHLVRHFGERMSIGAGTVVDVEAVERLAGIGCAFCVAPNMDTRVIAASLAHGMLPMPGVATATEAFAAVQAGARWLKVFPAAQAAATLAALRTVLPGDVRLLAVGGVNPDNGAALQRAGAHGFGLGADLYRPGVSAEAVHARALEWLAALARWQRPAATLLAQPSALVGESPLWRDGEVCWTDPAGPRLLRCSLADAQWRAVAVAAPLWSLAALPDGRLAGVGENAVHVVDPDSGRLVAGPPAALPAGVRFNDMTCDARGGLWMTSMHRGLLSGQGGIHHAPSPEAAPRAVGAGLGAGNGIALAADQRTLYVIDTLARTLLAYPADTATGRLGEPVVVSDFLDLPGKPDGMAIAADGTFWVAMWGGGCIAQLAADGAFLRAVPVPAPHVGSLCLDGRGKAYVTTARARLSPAMLAAHPGSGGLFEVVLPED